MRLRNILIEAGFIMLLGGCTTATLNVSCNPAGATLREDATGQTASCPVTLEHQITPEERQKGYVRLNGLTAIWSSGAHTSFPYINLDLRNGYNFNYTFQRPVNVPGYANDFGYGQQILAKKAAEEAYQNCVNRAYLIGAFASAATKYNKAANNLNATSTGLNACNN